MTDEDKELPSAVDPNKGWFDKFAEKASILVSKSYFFLGCIFVVVIWIPSFLIVSDLDIYQLLINTFTTIITFLLVALLQNTQARSNAALQQKLNAIALSLSELMRLEELIPQAEELEAAVGVETKESTV